MTQRDRVRRRPRDEVREELLAAAARVIARRGFHAASVEAISRDAGLSTGAIYSNFAGKDDLFLAVFDGHLRWFAEQLQAAADSSDTRRTFSDWMDSVTEEPEQLLVFIEFWAYAVRKPKLRRSFSARLAEMREAVAETIERRAAAAGADPALAPETLAVVMLALVRGLGLEKLADADAVDDAVAEAIGSLVP